VRQPSPTAVPLDFQIANEVVRLRALVADDALAVYRACQDPEIRHFTSFPEAADAHETRAWIESQKALRARGDAIDFGIVPVGGVTIVGAIGLSKIDLYDRHAEVGYWIAPRSRRRGFATAALGLLSSWAFGPPLELVRLGLRADLDNAVSRQTALRAGYGFEGVLRSYMFAKGRRWDLAQYSRIAPDPAAVTARASAAPGRAPAARVDAPSAT
jgi:RimJ/RimL family protein N-acetyltransferase